MKLSGPGKFSSSKYSPKQPEPRELWVKDIERRKDGSLVFWAFFPHYEGEREKAKRYKLELTPDEVRVLLGLSPAQAQKIAAATDEIIDAETTVGFAERIRARRCAARDEAIGKHGLSSKEYRLIHGLACKPNGACSKATLKASGHGTTMRHLVRKKLARSRQGWFELTHEGQIVGRALQGAPDIEKEDR